jgi:hypothetical protein
MLQIAKKKTEKFTLPESVNYQMKDAQFLLYCDDNTSIRIKFKENIFLIFKGKYIQNSQHN